MSVLSLRRLAALALLLSVPAVQAQPWLLPASEPDQRSLPDAMPTADPTVPVEAPTPTTKPEPDGDKTLAGQSDTAARAARPAALPASSGPSAPTDESTPVDGTTPAPVVPPPAVDAIAPNPDIKPPVLPVDQTGQPPAGPVASEDIVTPEAAVAAPDPTSVPAAASADAVPAMPLAMPLAEPPVQAPADAPVDAGNAVESLEAIGPVAQPEAPIEPAAGAAAETPMDADGTGASAEVEAALPATQPEPAIEPAIKANAGTPAEAPADATLGEASASDSAAAPVPDSQPEPPVESTVAPLASDESATFAVDPAQFVGPPMPDPDANAFGVSPMKILGGVVQPGTRERLSWTTGQSFSGSVMETPVIVVHGERPGPRLCLTGGVHGDELNGVEVVRRLAWSIEPDELSGTIIAVPIVNLLGFSRGSRYLPDRRDLNRFFPGSRNGSSASRIAFSFFDAVIEHCDALVDFHTGSFERANLPQVRGDLTNPAVVAFTRGFGATAVLHSPGAAGMLRHATSHRGIPAVTFEIGGPMRLDPNDIEHSVQSIETLMHAMGMSDDRRRWAEPQAVFYESRWIRADHGGMLFSEVELGDRVRAGAVLGRVIDPVSNHASQVLAPEDGRIIGMALNQLVLPGFAAYHLGIAASEERVVTEATMQAEPDDERFLEYDQLDPEPGADGPAGEDTAPDTSAPRRDIEREDG